MLHLLSRRAWKNSQQVARGEAAPPPPTPTYSKKRKRSPSPQADPEPPATKREKKGRPPKIKEEPEPEEEESEEDTFELPELALTSRPSRNRKKSAKILQIEKESASTSTEKDTPETPPSSTGRKKGVKTPQPEELPNVPITPTNTGRKKAAKTPQLEEPANVPVTPTNTGRKKGAKTPQLEEPANVPDTPTSSRRKKGAKTIQNEEPLDVPVTPTNVGKKKSAKTPKIEPPEPEEIITPTSKSRRKSSKSAQLEEETAVVEKEKTTSKRKSGKGDKSKEIEKEENKKGGKKIDEVEIKKEIDEGTSMTFTTGKGRKSKTTSIRIKPIVEPKKEPEPEVVQDVSHGGTVQSGSSHKKKKGKKQLEDLHVEIPTEPNITIKEESGIKLKLILSPKERSQSEVVDVKKEFEEPSPVIEEKKKSKKDKGKKDKGKKDKGKEESPKEEKIKAKLVFKDQVLSLDGDKVTHSEKSKSGNKSKKRKHNETIPDSPSIEQSGNKSKKRKHIENIPDSPSIEQSHKKQKSSKKKSEVEVKIEDEEIVSVASTKSDKNKKQLEIGDLVSKLEQRLAMSVEQNDEKSRTKSHKDKHRHKSKERLKLSDSFNSKKDKKKKKSRHERYIHDAPETPPRNDLNLSLDSDSLDDPDLSLVIDENPLYKSHSSSSKKKSRKDSDRLDERTKGDEKRKDKSRHKHHKHKHDKHRHKHVQLIAKQIAEHAATPKGIQGSPITPQPALKTASSGGPAPAPVAITDVSPTPRPSEGEVKKTSSASKSKKGKKDGDGPTPDGKKDKKEKKPMSAYLLWTRETRPGVVNENPGADFATISRLMGAKWHQLSDKEKLYWKKLERMQFSKHKNIPSLSAQKYSKHGKSRPKSPARMPSPNMEAIDIAAHLRLLGESLSNVGSRLQEHKGEIEIHGSVSVLLDSTLCALGPLMALTSQVPEIDGCSRDTHVSTLENIAYIMPGL